MNLFFAELRKVWGSRVFPALLAILAAANLLLLWMGTRPTAKQPPASAYHAVGAELSDKTLEEKGTFLHDKYTEIESLVKSGSIIGNRLTAAMDSLSIGRTTPLCSMPMNKSTQIRLILCSRIT